MTYIYIYDRNTTCDIAWSCRHAGMQVCRYVAGSQRTTTTNEPLPLVPVSKRVRMTRFVKSPLVTACSVIRPRL